MRVAGGFCKWHTESFPATGHHSFLIRRPRDRSRDRPTYVAPVRSYESTCGPTPRISYARSRDGGGLGQDTVAEAVARGHKTAAVLRDPARVTFSEAVESFGATSSTSPRSDATFALYSGTRR
jgi:hypothetical protein